MSHASGDVGFSCQCGSLQGVAYGVSARAGNHCVCYCVDCQCFARYLERADEVLDEHGGTAIYQLSAGKVEITHGQEHLACLRLSPNGLMRWYASCCNSPIANTLQSTKMPFAGMIMTVFGADKAHVESQPFGPIRARVQTQEASGDRSRVQGDKKLSLGIMLRFLRLSLKWRLQGAARTSPFHTSAVTPLVLSKEEREALKSA